MSFKDKYLSDKYNYKYITNRTIVTISDKYCNSGLICKTLTITQSIVYIKEIPHREVRIIGLDLR